VKPNASACTYEAICMSQAGDLVSEVRKHELNVKHVLTCMYVWLSSRMSHHVVWCTPGLSEEDSFTDFTVFILTVKVVGSSEPLMHI
jgi:hypothetical protein